MQAIESAIRERAKELVAGRFVDRVLGWKKGEYYYDNTPAMLGPDELDDLVYNSFCGANLCKYLIDASKLDGVTLALLKPCDTLSFNQLVKEHRIDRKKVYVLGVPCYDMLDVEKLRKNGVSGITGIEEEGDTIHVKSVYGDVDLDKKPLWLAKCRACKSKVHAAFDEILEDAPPARECDYDRFGTVKKLEAMTPEERFAFWRNEMSKCIRCNACRNVCPACSCNKCVFDNDDSGVAGKANVDEFEENMFHIIRAFHVAGRCTDCGECTRVCPQGIPLHLLNRKFIKDINEDYGEYQAGADDSSPWPLVSYELDDVEPGQSRKGGA